ncbi:unnamed protein product [Arabidopsis halleri]
MVSKKSKFIKLSNYYLQIHKQITSNFDRDLKFFKIE